MSVIDSAPLAHAYSAVATAPTPTQTAYPVPTGMDFNAQASPPMETTAPTTTQIRGTSLVKPSVRARFTAQIVSHKPESIKTIHAATALPSVSAFTIARVAR